jgi:hypothetical protein
MRRLLVLALVVSGLVELGVAGPAVASLIVGRNPQHPTLQLDASGYALVTFTSAGQTQHVLVWGAVNGLPPTRGRTQTAFKVDYSGGSGIHKNGYWKTFKNMCRPYTGPALAWYVAGSGCTAPDGSFWALQLWQRMLPNLGFKPWKPEQAVWELHVSHWTGPLAQLQVWTDWAWGGRFHQLVGQLIYGGKPVYGFGSTSVGAPTDDWGRNVYVDSYDSPYGAGWNRENSFLAQSPKGGFCYSFGPRPPYPGYPDAPPRQGNGSMYRITVIGPGVTADVMWQAQDPGDWDSNDPTKVATEKTVNAMKPSLDLSQSECHD